MADAALTLAHWTARAGALVPEGRHFIDGQLRPSHSGASFDSVNPATGAVLAQVARGDRHDVDAAVASAQAAWSDRRWRALAPRARIDILLRFADRIERHAEELALLETLDMGKSISDVQCIDLPEVLRTIRYFAECVDKIEGAVTHTAPGSLHMVGHQPLGVVGAIAPWNYPMLMAIWKLAPALAAGNCVVLKPSEQAPLSCVRMAQLFVDAGGPPGVFNVVNGLGSEAGQALALHPDVAKLTFTGSTAAGKLLLGYAGQSNMKRVALETGGKSPQIFFDHLYDLDPATTMGPVVSAAHRHNVLACIEQAIAEGADCALGAAATAGHPTGGAYVAPTLFAHTSAGRAINRQEVFGPVASMMVFDTEQQAIALANDSVYGLAAAVWSADLNRAHRCVGALEAGVVWVNCFGDGDMTQPFGGYKQSGNSRDKHIDSLLSYTQSKSAWFALG